MGPAKSTAHRSRPGRWDVPAANEEDTGAPPSQVQAINHPVDKIARASAKNRHTCAHAASTPGCRPASPSSTPQNRPQHNRERRGADAFAFAHSRGLPGLRVVHTVRGWRGPPARPRLTRSSPSSPSQAGRPTEGTHLVPLLAAREHAHHKPSSPPPTLRPPPTPHAPPPCTPRKPCAANAIADATAARASYQPAEQQTSAWPPQPLRPPHAPLRRRGGHGLQGGRGGMQLQTCSAPAGEDEATMAGRGSRPPATPVVPHAQGGRGRGKPWRLSIWVRERG